MSGKRISKLLVSAGVAALLALTPALASNGLEWTGQGPTAWTPSTGWTGAMDGKVYTDHTVTNTLPGGTSVTVSVSGTVGIASRFGDNSGPWTLDEHGGWSAPYLGNTSVYTPAVAISNHCQTPAANTVNFALWSQTDGYCATNTLNTNRGTMTVTFSHTVTNPVINFAGVGGYDWRYKNYGPYHAPNTMRLWTEFTLTSPANATMTQLTTNTGSEFAIDSTGKKYKPTGDGSTVSSYCTTTEGAANNSSSGDRAGKAGCGSIRINGSGTTFVFQLDYNSIHGATAGRLASGAEVPNIDNHYELTNIPTDDTFIVSFSAVTDDFGSAPASYDTAPTSHTVTDLYMGTGVTSDSSQDPTTGDAETNSAFKALASGPPAPGAVGSNYSVTVPVTGTAAGKLCGWVDWNGNGTFDTGERQCSTFASGTASKTLTWVVPAGATAAATWMRLRASYDTTGVESPVGPVNSGEVEDYAVAAAPYPAAVNDVSSGPMNTAQNQTVLGNDSSGNGIALSNSTIQLLNPSSNTYSSSPVTVSNQGTYSISGSTIVFTPVTGYTGTATPVGYQIANSILRTATATYTPTIVPPPTASNDISSGPLDTAQDQTVLGNDSSGNGIALAASTIKLFNPSTSTYGTSAVTVANQGTYTISNNKIVFTPVAGYVGTATPVTYQVADSLAQTATATYTPSILTAVEWAAFQARAAGLPHTGAKDPAGSLVTALMMAMAGASIYLASAATSRPRRRTGR